MFVIACLSITLLLAASALFFLRRAGRALRTGDTVLLLSVAAYAGFVYLYGTWIFLSVHARDVFALAALLTIIVGLLRKRPYAELPPRRNRRNAALAVVFGMLDLLYFSGSAGHVPVVKLHLPVKGGKYAVLQGGKGLPANVFHSLRNPAAYSMDIVKLDKWGRRCIKIFSEDLHDYYTFGDTVYAPCDGTVARAISDNPDNIPPHRERGPHNLNGVLIESTDCNVFLGHMQQGKVLVAAGDVVHAGQPIGLAGNSGMSIEPHLHIQAHMKPKNGEAWWAQPQLFMRFDGREYLLNEVIGAGQK